MRRISIFEFEVEWHPQNSLKNPYKVTSKIIGKKELIFKHLVDNFIATPRELGDGIKLSLNQPLENNVT